MSSLPDKSPRKRNTRRTLAAFTASALAFGGAAVVLGAQPGAASSHREAPQLLSDPQVDNTDVYAFVAPDHPSRVTIIGNWLPFETPAGGPNFYPFADDAHYNINIDNDGDARPDITYQWKFNSHYRNGKTFLYNTGQVTSLKDKDLNFRQTYTLRKITRRGTTVLARNVPVAPSDVGDASMPDYGALSSAAVHTYNDVRRTFAGQADDSFFLDLRVFDLLYGTDLSETGTDTLSGFNVNTIALQVPRGDVTRGDDPVIGVWSTTDRPSIKVQGSDGSQKYKGKYVQVSRLGNPLVNEVVIPVGLKDAFNALKPQDDASVAPAVKAVLDPEVPKLIEAIYGIPAPATPRDDLFSVFLTGVQGLNKPMGKVRPAEMLRLNTAIPPTDDPNRLGVLAGDNAGFPNGRRLTDDVVDIALQAMEGAVRTGTLNPALDDHVNANDVPFRAHFPYVALPHSGSETDAMSLSAAPDRNDSSAIAPTSGSGGSSTFELAPLAPIGVALGLGFGGLGVILMRRSRTQRVSVR
jgi:Domain of unknown function (DUF4331)